MGRTFRKLKEGELRRVLELALIEFERFLTAAGNPVGKYRYYRDRLICICLAQGAAQHFIDIRNINRFDAEVEVSRKKSRKRGSAFCGPAA